MRGNLLKLTLVALFFASCAQKAPPPPPPPASAPKPTFFEHTITFSGETLADIAQHYTGRATNWMIIRDANPGLKPDRLRIGQIVLIPFELVINDKPFTRSSLKRLPKPAVSPTPAPSSEAPPVLPPTTENAPQPETAVEPAPTPAAAPTAVAPTPEPTAVPTVVPEVKPESVPPAAPSAAPAAGDQDREKLLDELLK